MKRLVLVLVAVVGLAACGMGPDTTANDQLKAIRDADTKIAATVKATAAGFEPTTVTVKEGEAVEFVNADTVARHVVADKVDAKTGFDSGVQQPGDKVIVRFNAAGDVAFHDAKTQAKGTVTVTVTK